MAYDNLAGVVIQVLKYSTNMSFDVLVFVILDALANPDKERVKDDGVNTTDWLQSSSWKFSVSTPLSHHNPPSFLPQVLPLLRECFSGGIAQI